MKEIFEFLRTSVVQQFGTAGVFLCALLTLAIYAWYQHHRGKLLQERIDLEAEHRKLLAEELQKFKKPEVQPQAHSIPSMSKSDFGQRIIVADDESMLRDLLAVVISKRLSGTAVVEAKDGQDALEQICTGDPALLILDLMMPKKDGFDVLRELSSRNAKFPILVISAYATSIDEVIKLAGAKPTHIAFLGKPFSVDDFIAQITKMLKV